MDELVSTTSWDSVSLTRKAVAQGQLRDYEGMVGKEFPPLGVSERVD
ncbi:hypothetical protein [Singulisphaera acidiphila]|nr:hypothetical protein [Singulisphaera acidiphila]